MHQVLCIDTVLITGGLVVAGAVPGSYYPQGPHREYSVGTPGYPGYHPSQYPHQSQQMSASVEVMNAMI